MRRLLLCSVLLLDFIPAARAQDVEFFGGYSYLRTSAGDGGVGLNGWNVSATVNLLGSFGVVADLSQHYGAGSSPLAPVGRDGKGFTYLFGPQYSFRLVPHVTPFVHALFGGVQGQQVTIGALCPVSNPNCGPFTQPETAFALGLGGGVDLKAFDHVWIRLAQVDYIRESFSNGAVNSPRFSAGIVFRFGKKQPRLLPA
ncbi:MAG TPA: hypothetical protein VN203_26330, partial [Candidatus Acidoferrum sp.]|nr:hypothetical protein [Candidatus Acidoferrum sp.]